MHRLKIGALVALAAAALTIPVVGQQPPSASLVEYNDEVARTATAGIDFTGEWAPRFHEDEPERVPLAG